jgi:hypothetical protein
MHHENPVRQMFAQRVSNPADWYRNARALFAAARASRERYIGAVPPAELMDLDRVISMLYGFGLESLFKAAVVLKDFGDPYHEDWEPEAKFPKKLATHDLVKLAEMVDPELVDSNRWALEYFTEAVVWMGRYPSSKAGDEGAIIIDSNCFKTAEAIYTRLSIRFSISG